MFCKKPFIVLFSSHFCHIDIYTDTAEKRIANILTTYLKQAKYYIKNNRISFNRRETFIEVIFVKDD